MANLTVEETKLFLYESQRNGVINDTELNVLLESVDEAEYVQDLEEIVESVLSLTDDDSEEEDVLESVNDFLASRVQSVEDMIDSKNETKLNVYEAAKAGLIDEEEMGTLLDIVESVEI